MWWKKKNPGILPPPIGYIHQDESNKPKKDKQMICKKCKASEILGTTISDEERAIAQKQLWKMAKVIGSDRYDFVETLMALIMRMDEHINRLEEEVASLAEAERRREKLKGEL